MQHVIIHHVEIGIKNKGKEFVKDICHKYNLHGSGYRETPYSKQWLVRANSKIQFLVTELALRNGRCSNTADYENLIAEDPYVTLWDNIRPSPTTTSDLLKSRSSVFNVSLSVKNIQSHVERLEKCGAHFLKPLRCFADHDGEVRLATVKSCVGNVVHTLIDREDYRGHFLPGFTQIDQKEEEKGKDVFGNSFTHFDHITYAAEMGTSESILNWYEKAFGMKRFNLSTSEDVDEGFVINIPGVALRLKAFEYWKCAEVGVRLDNRGSNSILFVIAESLKGSAANQVDTFLQEHGPGIQHIGLHTNTIISTIDLLKQQGVSFIDPPYTYYLEAENTLKNCDIKESLSMLQKLGILIDVEYDNCDTADGDLNQKPKYLLQKFTKPIFDTDTFFLEVIQRNGALGFGAGNIIALWKSLQVLLDKKSHDTRN